MEKLKVTNAGAQIVPAINKQKSPPKSRVTRGGDLRGGK